MATRPLPLTTRCWNRLGSRELRRRLVHSGPGLLPLLLWPFPHSDPLSPTLCVILIVVSVTIALWVWRRYRSIQRYGETDGPLAVAGYAGSVLGTLLLFPDKLELGMSVLALLAFGDGCGTLAGVMLRGPRLPWNRHKTWSGLTGFVLVGTPAAAVIYWGEAQPAVAFGTALGVSAVGAVLAALVESLPVRLNDNVRVGVSGAIGLALGHAWLVGW